MYVLVSDNYRLDDVVSFNDKTYAVHLVHEYLSASHVPLDVLKKCQFEKFSNIPQKLRDNPVYVCQLSELHPLAQIGDEVDIKYVSNVENKAKDVPEEKDEYYSLTDEQKIRIKELCREYPTCGDYGQVYYNKCLDKLLLVLGDADDGDFTFDIYNNGKHIGNMEFFVEYDCLERNIRDELGIKLDVDVEFVPDKEDEEYEYICTLPYFTSYIINVADNTAEEEVF